MLLNTFVASTKLLKSAIAITLNIKFTIKLQLLSIGPCVINKTRKYKIFDNIYKSCFRCIQHSVNENT